MTLTYTSAASPLLPGDLVHSSAAQSGQDCGTKTALHRCSCAWSGQGHQTPFVLHSSDHWNPIHNEWRTLSGPFATLSARLETFISWTFSFIYSCFTSVFNGKAFAPENLAWCVVLVTMWTGISLSPCDNSKCAWRDSSRSSASSSRLSLVCIWVLPGLKYWCRYYWDLPLHLSAPSTILQLVFLRTTMSSCGINVAHWSQKV